MQGLCIFQVPVAHQIGWCDPPASDGAALSGEQLRTSLAFLRAGCVHGQNKCAAESPGCCRRPELWAFAFLIISKAVGLLKAGLVGAGCESFKTVPALQILPVHFSVKLLGPFLPALERGNLTVAS